MPRENTVGRTDADGMVHAVVFVTVLGYMGYALRCTGRRAPVVLKNANEPITCMNCLAEE
jgi:hypothetical protein